MVIRERIQSLREEMKERGIHAYIIPSSDPHQSEYVPERWKARQWISGFTGSAGTIVITMNDAGLWTDGRYYIQAEKELQETGIRLFKAAEIKTPTYEQWILENLSEGQCVGFDNSVLSVFQVDVLCKKMNKKNIELVKDYDLIDIIWKDRPKVPQNQVYIHDIKYAGRSIEEKLNELRVQMTKNNGKFCLITTLDDIAWLYNLRGSDVSNTPVFVAYALISMDKAWLFINKEKITHEVEVELKKHNVEVDLYENIKTHLKKLGSEDFITLDPGKTNSMLYDAIGTDCQIINIENIVTNIKTIKNDVEIQNIKNCNIKDGVAMVKFLYWIDTNLGSIEISEISAAEKLKKFRSEQEKFMDTSFDTISGYKEHAAMMHYKATPSSEYILEKEGMFLVDSGGQYLDGTTDITRTIVLGELTEEEKRDFTLVLKGHLALAKAKFLYGATGTNLDILARQPMWENGIDYKCGTGHGLGMMLSVHEAPQRFSITYNNTRLEKGMLITNEPGIYREGKHGIRIENTLLVAEDKTTEFGTFMKFETISYCPIDLKGIDINILNAEEIKWINDYHKKVYNNLNEYLDEEEKQWLKNATREI